MLPKHPATMPAIQGSRWNFQGDNLQSFYYRVYTFVLMASYIITEIEMSGFT